MRTQARSTSCPLCGTPLGATVEGCWVPMSLDEYREYALTRMKELTAPLSADRCIGCHAALDRPKRELPSVRSASPVMA